MPPAFNLSQDQTLQFNLCFALDYCLDGIDSSSLRFLSILSVLVRARGFVREASNRSIGAHTYRF